MYHCSLERMNDKIKTFSTFGDAGHGGITRLSLSPEALMARAEYIRRMEAAGATVVSDDMANLYATLPGSEPGLPSIAMASHCDSVRNGGNYDGILGVLAAMEVVDTISSEHIPHRHPITAMIWTDEEGALYPPAMLSSGVVCGKFTKEEILESHVPGNRTFGEALAASGYAGEEKNRLNPTDYMAMLELHIEQGPILEAAGKDIGVVQCVLGMVNYRIKCTGQSNHAGTTPMPYRKDALFAAAQALIYLHKELDKLDPSLVYTTGEILCHPCIHTVIPDYVEFSLDARHESAQIISQVVDILKHMPDTFAGCSVTAEEAWARNTVYFDNKLINIIQDQTDKLGYTNMPINSGAGHDAQYAADYLPTTMIFVPSKDGRSHCEEEYTSPEQCTMGANVLLNAVLVLDLD